MSSHAWADGMMPRSVLPAVLTAAPHLLWLLHPLEDKPMGMQMIVMDDDMNESDPL